MSPILAELVAEIDAFLAGYGMSETAFGEAVFHDKHFVRELRRGRDCQASSIDRCRTYIAAHWVDAGGAAQPETKANNG